jgi:hypothetical protein
MTLYVKEVITKFDTLTINGYVLSDDCYDMTIRRTATDNEYRAYYLNKAFKDCICKSYNCGTCIYKHLCPAHKDILAKTFDILKNKEFYEE